MNSCTLVRKQWEGGIRELVRAATSDLVLASPYITSEGAELIASCLGTPSERGIRLTFITNLSVASISQGSTDPGAIQALSEAALNTSVYHLPRLHAKVYVADGGRAIVTSANLTAGGLLSNYEYGIQVNRQAEVLSIRRDVMGYASLGARINQTELEVFCALAAEARHAFRQRLAAATRAATERFRRALRRAEDQLLRYRLAGGPLHTVFGRTILYLLRRHGPLPTTQLHSLIQAIHPDLCDDSVDRVIDGKRFGKKWKHAVRSAQQQLKRRALAALDGGRWVALSADHTQDNQL